MSSRSAALDQYRITRRRYSRVVVSRGSEQIESIEKAFARGDEGALKAAYQCYSSLVYTFCCRTLDESRAEDVIQEVFISAWKSHMRYEPARGSLAGWLIAIAKNRIIDNVRAEQRHSLRRADADINNVAANNAAADNAAADNAAADNAAVAVDDTFVEARVDAIADRLLVAEALRCLSDRARQVVTMHYFDDLTLRQIAETTGQPLGTVKSDLRRALARFRQQLEPKHG